MYVKMMEYVLRIQPMWKASIAHVQMIMGMTTAKPVSIF